MQLSHAVIHTNCPENEQPLIFTPALPSKIFHCLGIQNDLDPLQSLFDSEPKFNFSACHSPAS